MIVSMLVLILLVGLVVIIVDLLVDAVVIFGVLDFLIILDVCYFILRSWALQSSVLKFSC